MKKPRNTRRLEHWVSREPFNAMSVQDISPEQQAYYLAPQWKLMWWKLRRHRLAVWAGILLAVMYASILVSEVLAPYNPNTRTTSHIYAPPQSVHFFHEGRFIGPFVYGYDKKLDMRTLKRIYTENPAKVQHLRFFCSGDSYNFWLGGRFDFHLVCPAEGGTLFLLGTDRLGRDMLSRLIHGTRISLTVGLIGIIVSFTLGIAIGGVAGYFGGMVDSVVQRSIEIFKSIPTLPLLMALAAAIPPTWSVLVKYFGVTIILGLLDWPGAARTVRSKLLALREEDFAVAARLMGASPTRIIARHLVPNFASHLIASLTLSIPAMIFGETALSFLGLGLQAPMISWGVLLIEAQNISAVELYPWLMAPVVPVFLTVLAFNFFGDGLRDAADPYR
ncbi:MAG: ABC transporter permease [Rhodospirillales bacterium]